MSSILPCTDWRDAVLLCPTQHLYLKPLACIWISVQLPPALKKTGKSISTFEIMDRIKSSARPHEIIGMKVLKSTLEVVRFEAHLESRHQIPTILERLDHTTLRLNSFAEPLKLRACESKLIYPSRHDWDTYFHENKNMNELKPGERPDTVHITSLPCHWFMNSTSNGTDLGSLKLRPSESIVRSIFEVFGPVRSIDIPMLDPYRPKIVPSSNTFAFGQDGLFEAYIQFQEYVGFVKCMTAFRGMKLLYRQGNSAWTAFIQVDFDRTRHQSENAIKERRIARDRIIQEEIDQERADKIRRELENITKQEESRRLQKEEETSRIIREKEDSSKIKKEEEDTRLALEERKLVLVQRRLESLRLLDAVLERVKGLVENKEKRKKDNPKKKEKSKKMKEAKRKLKLEEKEKALRARLVKKYQQVGERLLEEQREKVRQTVQDSALKLKSAVNVVAEIKPSSGVVSMLAASKPQPGHEFHSERINNDHRLNSATNRRQSMETYRTQPPQHSEPRNAGVYCPRGPNQHSSFHKKRFTSESFPRFGDRGNGKRGRFQSNMSVRDARLDNELWDGPDMQFQKNASFPRGGRGAGRGGDRGGYHHQRHRTRDFYPAKD